MENAIRADGLRNDLLEECFCRAVELLRRNSRPEGVLAALESPRSRERRYTGIFGRDAAICALGMLAADEKDLVETARAGLLTLGKHQARNGQIPKFVHPGDDETDFWYTGCIDATLWWLIAVRAFDRQVGLEDESGAGINAALGWLSCQEHPAWGLLQQNEASDWADIMPRSGFVLYSNALWFVVKRIYGLPGVECTRAHANILFSPFDHHLEAGHRRLQLLTDYIRNSGRNDGFLLSFVNFSFWGEEIDIFGNLLAVLGGITGLSTSLRIVENLRKGGFSEPWPVRVVGRPIERENPLWRTYMARHGQNLPHQYHNGGIWPFVGGFWILLLESLGRREEAWRELEKLALLNRAGNWEFNEWFHGLTGEPMGMPGQSWNAALFILAYRVLCDGYALPFLQEKAFPAAGPSVIAPSLLP